MLSKECMLTTFDNPYDYFTQFDQWLLFDKSKGYNTCEHLARIAQLSSEMTQKEENEEIERACDTIIELDFMNIYKKVYKQESKD